MIGNKANSRIVYVDVIKGIMILLVVYGHSALPKAGSLVSPFHMPMFFFIAGYFTPITPLGGGICRQARKSLLPYFITGTGLIIWTVYDFEKYGINRISKMIIAVLYGAGSSRFCILPTGIDSIGPIWFFLGYLISVTIVRKVKNHKYALWICIVCAYVGQKTAERIWLPFSIQAGMFASVFVYLGYMAKQTDYLSRIKDALKVNHLLLLGMIGVWAFCSLNGQISLAVGAAKGSILDILGAICACTLIALFAQKWDESKSFIKLKKALAYIGQNSLVILCCHGIEQRMIAWGFISNWGNATGLSSIQIELIKLGCRYCLLISAMLIISLLRKSVIKRKLTFNDCK